MDWREMKNKKQLGLSVLQVGGSRNRCVFHNKLLFQDDSTLWWVCFHFNLHFEDLIRNVYGNSSNSNKVPLIRIKVWMLAWSVFLHLSWRKQLCQISADVANMELTWLHHFRFLPYVWGLWWSDLLLLSGYCYCCVCHHRLWITSPTAYMPE